MRHQAQILRGLTALLSLLLVMLTTALPAQEAPAAGQNYGELAELLENDATRQQLIDQLRGLEAAANPAPLGLEGEVPPAEIAAQAPSGQTAEQVSLARRMASATGNLAGDMGRQFAAMSGLVTGWFASDDSAGEVAATTPVNMKAVTAALLVRVATLWFGVLLGAIYLNPTISRGDVFKKDQAGERVLVHSAGGGVGLAALQIAKWRGRNSFPPNPGGLDRYSSASAGKKRTGDWRRWSYQQGRTGVCAG